MTHKTSVSETHLSDMCLLLRAHGEQRWLLTEIAPVVRELEHPDSIPSEQLGAALAYLEVLWLDGCRRAAETDAAYATLDREDAGSDRVLHEKARRYHAAVRRLRHTLAGRVAQLTSVTSEPIGHEHVKV